MDDIVLIGDDSKGIRSVKKYPARLLEKEANGISGVVSGKVEVRLQVAVESGVKGGAIREYRGKNGGLRKRES